MRHHPVHRQRGFSLVELIVVIVLVGIIGGVLSMQLAPAIQSYLLVGQRAALTSQADTALRTIVTEVRSAVPNSLRLRTAQCLDLVPTKDGGRYRSGPDTANGGVAGNFLDATGTNDRFDVLTPLGNPPLDGDAIVIGNQNTGDVYSQVNVGIVDGANTGSASSPATGVYGIRLRAPIRVPPGYDGGRFLIVPAAEKVVTYACTGVGASGGTGSGTLVRFASDQFHNNVTCTIPADRAVVATKVSHCAFIYSPNQGATQENGFVQLQLTLSDKGEAVPLTLGAHVDNMP